MKLSLIVAATALAATGCSQNSGAPAERQLHGPAGDRALYGDALPRPGASDPALARCGSY